MVLIQNSTKTNATSTNNILKRENESPTKNQIDLEINLITITPKYYMRQQVFWSKDADSLHTLTHTHIQAKFPGLPLRGVK